MPHLPKMLQSQAILDTLVDGCEQGAFVLRLTRPDKSFRTWWRSRPDETAMNDSALELVLPEAAELTDLPHSLLVKGRLPELWQADEITVQNVFDYFSGNKVIQIQREGYTEPVTIPSADGNAVNSAIGSAVESGLLWLTSGPASVLAEPIPAGLLTENAVLRVPPMSIAAYDILPENLSDAWAGGNATALSIATALSQKEGLILPWKTVKDVITAAVNARFLEFDKGAGGWPCEFPAAQTIKLKAAEGGGGGGGGGGGEHGETRLVVSSVLEPSEIQDLGDVMPQLLDLKAKTNVPLKFNVQIELGDGEERPSEDVVKAFNNILKSIKEELELA